MQIVSLGGDILHEISNPISQEMSDLFSGIKKKNLINLLSAGSANSAVLSAETNCKIYL